MQQQPSSSREAGSGQPLLMLRGIGKTFSNGVTALRDADLTLREGDFVSLLGPSGCGKSTALRIIAGLSMPTSGTLDWRGPGHAGKSNIGFVFQEPTLMPWANVVRQCLAAAAAEGRVAPTRRSRRSPNCSSACGSPASRKRCRANCRAA